MPKSNERIIKKLSKRAAEFMPNVNWDYEDDEPYCEWWDSLLPGTPVLWYRCSYEYNEHETKCAWAVLKMIFINERDSSIHEDGDVWFWGRKPTPSNVFRWAFWNPGTLEHITERHFGY
ncbi:TPA: hypothetical protein NG563_004607 [Vibrio parahaemolyticus]|nr:hypothetical protein [Vibrio parahaemolyticus]